MLSRWVRPVKYKNSFKCHKCPQSSGEDGCPAWNEIIMTNVQTGEDKIVKGCHFQVMPLIMVESIKASNVSTNTFAAIKNEVARGYSVLAQALPGFVKQLADRTEKDED